MTRLWGFGALALTVILALGMAGAGQAQTEGETGTRTVPAIHVKGAGEIVAVPDMVRFTLGVSATAPTADEALEAVAVASNDSLDVLRAAGLPEADIQTGSVRLDPFYRSTPISGSTVLDGYAARSTILVTVRDLDLTGALLSDVVEGGTNELRNLSYDVSNRDALEIEARRAAIADARAKAEVYAEAAEVALGPVLQIVESGAGGAPVMPMMAEMASGGARSSLPVAPGEITVRDRVTVVYGISY